MITEQDLLEAIAKCQGVRNPTANTAIKLAAYLIILDHLREGQEEPHAQPAPAYSYAPPPDSGQSAIHIDSDSDFARAVDGRTAAEVWPVVDELMETLQAMHPRLYDAVMRRFD